jgi:hypothetical protein
VSEWQNKDLAALVRSAQREAAVRIAQAIEAECDDVERWPDVGNLRALRAAARIARDYAERTV